MSTLVAGVDVSPEHLIGGRRVGFGQTFTDISPIDQSVIAEVARGGPTEAEMAVAAARDAFPGWAALGPAGRAPYLRRLADLIDASIDRIAMVECLDMAMLQRSLQARVIGRGARNFRSYAELAEGYSERVWSSGSTDNRVIRMPSGPAAVITPWNAPFMLSTWKTAPALAAGSTVILKPPEWAPLSCSILARADRRSRLPAGRLQRRCRESARKRAPRSSPTRVCAASASPARPRRAARSARRPQPTSFRSPPSSAARGR